LEAPPKLINL